MLQSKLSNPLLTNKFTLYPGDTLQTKLSLVLMIMDGYSGKILTSGINVLLKASLKMKPIINVSGYYCFTRLHDDVVNIIVEPINGDYGVYFKHNQVVDLSVLDDKDPVVQIFMIPKSNYPFPKQATLIRGSIVSNNKGVEEASIVAIYTNEKNNDSNETDKLAVSKSDHNGEFALALNRIQFHDNKKPPIQDVHIIIKLATFEKTVLIEGDTLNEGEMLNIGNIQFP